MKQWYTLYTKPNAEYQVAAVLQQRDIEIFLPEIETQPASRLSNRKPFFPCYLFMNIDFETVGISLVQWTPGLRRIVTLGGQPVPLPCKIIQLIRRKLEEIRAQGGPPPHSFNQGDLVYITDGPFQNMLAVFDGPTTPAKRVQVLLDILGHAGRVHVDAADLKKAPAEVEPLPPRRQRRTRGRGRPIRGTA